MISTLAITVALAAPAQAGKCDSYVAKATSAKGDALVKAYSDLARCDQKLAEESYRRFRDNSGDVPTLVLLSKAAILWETWTPVWMQLGEIPDYDARDEVAREIGLACADEPKVVSFLQGAYFGLRDIDFQRWGDAFIACESEDLTNWLINQVQSPPDRQFDEKFNALMDVMVQKMRADALPHLAKGAIKAAQNGPYDAILFQMDASVTPGLGESLKPEEAAALESALIQVAKAVTPDKARAVADRLANKGAESAAASLLPSVYPDRIQSGGGFLYGGVAIEVGDCKGTKTAVLHYAEINEPGKRWIVLGDIEKPLRGLKPKLSKCDNDGSEWAIAATPEPVKSGKDVEAWVEKLAEQWTSKGFDVKTEGEKAIKLP